MVDDLDRFEIMYGPKFGLLFRVWLSQ